MTKFTETDTSEIVKKIRAGDKAGIVTYLRDGGDPNARNNLGWTLLHIACVENQADIADILLDSGAMVNCCTVDMSTPLHQACQRGNKKAVEVLVQKGAYINAQDKAGNTSLHEAAKGMYTNIVKFLLNQKADSSRLNKRNQTYLDMVGQQLMSVVESGDIDVLLDWLDWGLSPNTVGNLNWSILHHAAARGQINIASTLIERQANVNFIDSNRSSPLHAASFYGHIKIAELLLKAGASVNVQDQMGNTPLHSAIAGGHPELMNILLENGCDTSIPNYEGQIFTHLVNDFLVEAVDKDQNEQVISLLKGRANPDTKDKSGSPVLCCASFKGNLVIANALLAAGADPNLCSEDTLKSPLHYVSSLGHFFVLKSLLDGGANVTLKDRKYLTPLHEAAREGSEDTVIVLIGRGASLNGRDQDGNTPLHVAAKWGQTEIVQMLIEKGAEEEIMNKNGHLYSDLALIHAVRTNKASQVMAGLAWGGNPNVQDSKGWTLLHHAVYKGTEEVCSLLLDSGADVTIVSKHRRTALMLACYGGHTAMVKSLINAGSNIDYQDLEGNTALHWASDQGSVETVEFLIFKNANRDLKNDQGLYYHDFLLKHLYFAIRHNEQSTVESLLKAGANPDKILEGTETTPREEAKRRRNHKILHTIVKICPPKHRVKIYMDSTDFFEDIGSLYDQGDDFLKEELVEKEEMQKNETYDKDHDWSESSKESKIKIEEAGSAKKNEDLIFLEDTVESDENFENEESALNVSKNEVINSKDFFKEEEENFWKYWDDKPEIINNDKFFREESDKEPKNLKNHIYQESSSEEDLSTESSENESVSSDISSDSVENCMNCGETKNSWENVVSAKEFFKEDECWWSDAVEDLQVFRPFSKDNAIPAKEFFKEDIFWWFEEKDNDSNVCIENEAINKENEQKFWKHQNEESCDFGGNSIESDKCISAKDFFKEEENWWENVEKLNTSESSSATDERPIRDKVSEQNITSKVSTADIFLREENSTRKNERYFVNDEVSECSHNASYENPSSDQAETKNIDDSEDDVDNIIGDIVLLSDENASKNVEIENLSPDHCPNNNELIVNLNIDESSHNDISENSANFEITRDEGTVSEESSTMYSAWDDLKSGEILSAKDVFAETPWWCEESSCDLNESDSDRSSDIEDLECKKIEKEDLEKVIEQKEKEELELIKDQKENEKASASKDNRGGKYLKGDVGELSEYSFRNDLCKDSEEYTSSEIEECNSDTPDFWSFLQSQDLLLSAEKENTDVETMQKSESTALHFKNDQNILSSKTNILDSMGKGSTPCTSSKYEKFEFNKGSLPYQVDSNLIKISEKQNSVCENELRNKSYRKNSEKKLKFSVNKGKVLHEDSNNEIIHCPELQIKIFNDSGNSKAEKVSHFFNGVPKILESVPKFLKSFSRIPFRKLKDEKFISSQKPSVNMMDQCLSRLDASLAILDQTMCSDIAISANEKKLQRIDENTLKSRESVQHIFHYGDSSNSPLRNKSISTSDLVSNYYCPIYSKIFSGNTKLKTSTSDNCLNKISSYNGKLTSSTHRKNLINENIELKHCVRVDKLADFNIPFRKDQKCLPISSQKFERSQTSSNPADQNLELNENVWSLIVLFGLINFIFSYNFIH